MDDKRFDSLTRAFATGTNRRKFLLGLVGLGGAAVVGTELGGAPAEAARRPTPTPTPPRCPGVQTWNGTKCVCPAGLSQCVPDGGPDCCNDQNVSPGAPGYSECCDNACCFGTCTAEEICCSTNSRAGGLPPTNRICESAQGVECCLFSDVCCLIDGCCPTVCVGGASGLDSCCPAEDFCPGGSESPDLCCAGNTVCCGGGTNANACVDLNDDDNNCGACGNVCPGCSTCEVGVCTADDDECPGEEICCPDGNTFTCEDGPFCGCDVDADCPACNRCNEGTCEPICDVATQECCPNLGTHGLCVSNVPGAGCCTTPECTSTGPDACLVGTCSATGVCSYAPNNALCGPDCGVCSAAGVCSDNQGACLACETCVDGTCVGDCSAEQPVCCPGPPEVCVAGSQCCPGDNCGTCGACVNGTCAANPQIDCGSACAVCNQIPVEGGFIYNCVDCPANTTCCGETPEGCVDLDTDDNNCGACGNVCPGCSTCQAGVCTADDEECPGEEICCPARETFICETGPFCGCDVDADCPACNRCDEGECVAICDPATQECCPNLGTHGLCVSNVEGVGCCVNAECTDTGEDACLVGECSATGTCSYAPNNNLCIDEDPCTDGICSPTGVCSFPSDCSNNPELCCPGCLVCNDDTGQCTESDANCNATGPDACLVGACNADGSCTYTPNNALCDEGTPCQDGTCNADGSCTYTGDCSNDPVVCCPGCLDCVGTACVQNNENCTDTGEDACLVGTCNANGTCTYTPNNALCSDTNPCTDGVCSAEGVCSFPTDCANDPGFCCPGCLDCPQAGGACVENNNNCITPPNTLCYVSPGDCTGTGECTYTPQQAGFDCGVCRTCDGLGACLIVPNNTDPGDDCADGSTCCGGVCTSINTNINCGACGIICPAGQLCVSGVCTPTCPPVPGTDCTDVPDLCPCLGGGGICENGVCLFLCQDLLGNVTPCFPNPVNPDAQCCRPVGGTLACKTGEGNCLCDSDSDCTHFTPPECCAVSGGNPGQCTSNDQFCADNLADTVAEPTEDCTPGTCATLGCGQHPDDGCGNALDCGACCTPKDVCLDTDCGTVDDGCGGTIECTPCCVPATCETIGSCGAGLDAGCGVLIDCPCPEEPVACIEDGEKCDPAIDVCCGADMACSATGRRGVNRCQPAA